METSGPGLKSRMLWRILLEVNGAGHDTLPETTQNGPKSSCNGDPEN